MKIKSKIYWMIAGSILLTLTGCKTLQETAESKKYVEPEGVTLMSEAELRSTLTGNTYAGDSIRHPGSSYIEFIQPDGTIRGLWNGSDRYQGQWVISGKIWCFKYQSLNGCNTLAKSGDTIFWYHLDGTTKGGKAIVTAGDPNNLGQ